MRTSAALIAATALALCSPPTAGAQVASALQNPSSEGAGAKDVAPCPSGYVAQLANQAGPSSASTSAARAGGGAASAAGASSSAASPGYVASTATPSAPAYSCVLSTLVAPRRAHARSRSPAADYKAPSLFGDETRRLQPPKKSAQVLERHPVDYGLAESSGYGARDVAGYGAKQTDGYGHGQVSGYGRSESMSIDSGRSDDARTSSPQAPGL
jgi:hypothetical protein